MKNRVSLPKVGIEIEVNNLTGNILDSVIRNSHLWTTTNEHCGSELVSVPVSGAKGIRSILRSIKEMEPYGHSAGFIDAGTHIHIDFVSSLDSNMKDLVRKTASKCIDGSYSNPFNNGKRYFWVSPDGNIWAKPTDFLKRKLNAASTDSPSRIFRNTKEYPRILRDVKRFMRIGIRFADVLIALQHPDRRFNKYCHTIGDWDEKKLKRCNTIADIAMHENLQQNHRRMMFNLLSFEKFGTIEVRMIKASLNHREILDQISLFVSLAAFAKSGLKLPKKKNTLAASFTILMDACGIHGKLRRRLSDTLEANMECKQFYCICYNWGCRRREQSVCYKDMGLSRGLCRTCSTVSYCSVCGIPATTTDMEYPTTWGRPICFDCRRDISIYRRHEKSSEGKYYFGLFVGSGLRNGVPDTLARLHGLYG